MKLSQMIAAYKPGLKAELLVDVTVSDNGSDYVFKAGTISQFLIDKGDGTYHFEADDHAFTAKLDEIKLL